MGDKILVLGLMTETNIDKTFIFAEVRILWANIKIPAAIIHVFCIVQIIFGSLSSTLWAHIQRLFTIFLVALSLGTLESFLLVRLSKARLRLVLPLTLFTALAFAGTWLSFWTHEFLQLLIFATHRFAYTAIWNIPSCGPKSFVIVFKGWSSYRVTCCLLVLWLRYSLLSLWRLVNRIILFLIFLLSLAFVPLPR